MPDILARTEDGIDWVTINNIQIMQEDLPPIPSYNFLPSPQDSLSYEIKAYIREVCAAEVRKWLTEHCSTTLQI